MTSQTPLAEGRHNHPPRCCCHLELDQGRCPACPEHGGLAEPVCDCYPGGCTPDTYEGPQHHCRVHGHGPDCCESCHTVDHPHTEYCRATCAGECLSGSDIGIPGPGIAYPHPDCPAHGDQWVPADNEWSRQYVADHPDRFRGHEQRPDDDPADEITCNGRNCGGYPHA